MNYILKAEASTLHNLNALSLFGTPQRDGHKYMVEIAFDTWDEAVDYLVERIKGRGLDEEEEMIEDAKLGGVRYDGVFGIIYNNIKEDDSND